MYDRPDHAHLVGGQDHGDAEHAVPVINHSLHKSILKDTEVDKLSTVIYLSSSLPEIDQNPAQQSVETLASSRLPVEPFFPLSHQLPPLSHPHLQAPQQSEHKYRYSPTPVPYKE